MLTFLRLWQFARKEAFLVKLVLHPRARNIAVNLYIEHFTRIQGAD